MWDYKMLNTFAIHYIFKPTKIFIFITILNLDAKKVLCCSYNICQLVF